MIYACIPCGIAGERELWPEAVIEAADCPYEGRGLGSRRVVCGKCRRGIKVASAADLQQLAAGALPVLSPAPKMELQHEHS